MVDLLWCFPAFDFGVVNFLETTDNELIIILDDVFVWKKMSSYVPLELSYCIVRVHVLL